MVWELRGNPILLEKRLELPSERLRVYISGVTKCVTKFLTLSQSVGFDSVKNFVTHFVTPEIWILIHFQFYRERRSFPWPLVGWIIGVNLGEVALVYGRFDQTWNLTLI